MKDKISKVKSFIQEHKTGIAGVSGVAVGVAVGIRYSPQIVNYECILTTTDEHLKTLMRERTLGLVFETKVGKMTLRAVEDSNA